MDKLLSFLPNDSMVKIGGVVAILIGLLQMTGFSPEFLSTTTQGWELVLVGWGMIGFGRKFERIAKGKG